MRSPAGTAAEVSDIPGMQACILDSMTEAVTIADESGTIFYANPAAGRLFGCRPGELVGRHLALLTDGTQNGNLRLFEGIRAALRTAGSWSAELRSRRKDGSAVDIFNRISLAQNGDSRWIVCVQEDISERKRSERELRNRAEDLSDFVENASVALHRVGADGTILWANRAELELLGYSPQEYIGRHISEFHVDRKSIDDILARLSSGSELREYEARLRAKDGSIRHVLISSNVRSKDGGFINTRCITHDVTDQKAAEHELHRLAAIVESSDDAIVAKDLDGIIRSWNNGAQRIFGYSAGEVVGKHISMLAPAEVRDEIPGILARIGRGERVDHYETRRRRKDGKIINVSLTVSPIRDSRGNITGASKIARDVTERKHTEETLRELERQLMLLIEASSALLASPESAEVLRTIVRLAQKFVSADAHSVWRRNPDGLWKIESFAGLSDEYGRHGAIQPSDPERVPTAPLIVPDITADSFLESRREPLVREGVCSVLVVPLSLGERPFGTLVFYWRTPHKFSEREVRIAAALGNLAASAMRTSDLYQRQLQLRADAEAAEQRASFLADAGAVLASSLDYHETLSSVVRLAVPGFADWAGVDLVIDGQVQRVAVSHADPDKVRYAWELARLYPPREEDLSRVALRTGQSFLIEEIHDDMIAGAARDEEHLRILRSLGLRSCIIAPMFLGGDGLGLITFVTAESGRQYSRSDLQTAEELARRAVTALEHARLFARSQAAQRALEHSNTELRRVNADLEQFAFSASHDLQEPLRMVGVYSQMLSRRYGNALDERADEYLGYMVEGARRMELLIRDLLEYTRVAAVSENEQVDPVEAGRVLDTVILNLRGAIEAAHARIIPGNLPRLLVKEVHLVQLFQNLVGNAIKYRAAEPPVVEVTAAEQEGGMWRICIRDNGIGIDPQFADQVFGIFKRLHRSDQYSGTGIGLAICQKIVHRYGGSIWVESAGEGRGCTFCFTLPGVG